jgi:deoxycytidylate deaminase
MVRKITTPIRLYVYGEDVLSGKEIVAVNPCADCATLIVSSKLNITVVGRNEYGEVVEWDRRTLYKEIKYVERA